MKRNMLIILAILMTLSSIFAMDIEIGSGTTTSRNLPTTGWYRYSWSNFIISANLIGMEAEFNQIKVQPGNNPAGYTFTGQKIYFKETTDAVVTANYPNPETNGFTLVYEGDITFTGNDFQGVMLDTPFEYDGTSNLQIVWENYTGQWASGYPEFYQTDVGSNVSAFNTSDGASLPTDAGELLTYFPNLVLSFPAENEPTIATYIAPANNEMNIPLNTTLQWQLGENTTDVDVYFSDSISEVNSMNTAARVINGQNVTSYQANNLTALTDYYWRVSSRNSANGLVMNGPVWKFTTEAGAGIVAVPVGDGTTSDYYYPFNFWYKNSIAETIYLAEEINIGGLLTTISYYNTFTSNLSNKPIKIWVGETTQTDLTDYIPASQLTEVFSGNVDFPAGQNTITINLDTPYAYSGGNLVVLTERPLDTDYYSTGDKFFNTVTDMPNRSIWWQSDSADYDPNNMTGGNRVNKMPNVVFYFAVSGMGSVSGTVTDGTTGLGGVAISIDDTNYHTLSLPDGSFEFPYVSEEDDYTLTASLHGYHDVTATFDVVEDEETIVNLEMVMLDNVTVSGQVITNDTGLGIQAHVMLTGYETYEADTDASGNFTIAGVFSNQTYSGTATAEGYQPGSFQAVVGAVDLDLGTILVTETLYPATNVVATLEGNNASIIWNAATAVDGIDSFSEDFESGDFSNWEEFIQGPGTPGDGGTPYWYIGAPDGAAYDGNCAKVDWGYDIDTWLITPFIAMGASTSINFEFNTSYHWFVDPNDHGDLSVKVSNDGVNWTELWTEDDVVFVNFEWVSVSIPMNEYSGQALQVAFNLTGSDNANLHMDNVYIGDARSNSNVVVATPNNIISDSAKANNSVNASYTLTNHRRETNTPEFNNPSRAFESYNLYRFLIADEANIADWTLVEGELTDTTYTDTGWSALDTGFYKYAVRAVYTNDAEATPAISNWLQNSATADVTVNVDSNLGEDIAEANVTLTAQEPNPNGEYSEFSGETDASGTAVITVNTGMYNISVTAVGFTAYSGEVDATADVTVNVT